MLFYQLSPQNMGLFEYGINRNFSILNIIIIMYIYVWWWHGAVAWCRRGVWHDAGVALWHDAGMAPQHVRVSMWRPETNCGLSWSLVIMLTWQTPLCHHSRPCSKDLKSLLFCCRCFHMHCCDLNMIWNSWQVLFSVERCWKLLTLWRYLIVI